MIGVKGEAAAADTAVAGAQALHDCRARAGGGMADLPEMRPACDGVLPRDVEIQIEQPAPQLRQERKPRDTPTAIRIRQGQEQPVPQTAQMVKIGVKLGKRHMLQNLATN